MHATEILEQVVNVARSVAAALQCQLRNCSAEFIPLWRLRITTSQSREETIPSASLGGRKLNIVLGKLALRMHAEQQRQSSQLS